MSYLLAGKKRGSKLQPSLAHHKNNPQRKNRIFCLAVAGAATIVILADATISKCHFKGANTYLSKGSDCANLS